VTEQHKDIRSFLQQHKTIFLEKWRERVESDLQLNKNIEEGHNLNPEDFIQLFQAYMDFMLDSDQPGTNNAIVDLVQRKIKDGFLLSTLELINAAFMSTARQLFRTAYPDAFNTRMEYLEQLSQMILNNEVTMAHYYEKYLKDLNMKLVENASILTQHNTSLVEFIDIATHQLQAPLWSILGFVSKLQRKHYESLDDEGRHCLNRISANVSDMHQLIEDVIFMLVISQEDMVKKRLYLNDMIFQAINRVHSEVDKEFICTIRNEETLFIMGDPNHFKQLFYHLLKNAAQFKRKEDAGHAFIAWDFDTMFHLYIEDDGIGIDERYAELIFQPMERLKDIDISGSGMGLTFARRIVSRHGGSIQIEKSTRYKGTCVHIQFPLEIISKI